MGSQTIVGVVAEDEEFAVGEPDFLHHVVADDYQDGLHERLGKL